jgi:peptidyl-prolyl cis-trans isomerase SurA
MTKLSLAPLMTGAMLLWIALVGPGAGVAHAQDARIAAVVNGQVITDTDVANRARLFALTVGMRPDPQILQGLYGNMRDQMVDQVLEQQEMARRNISVSMADVAKAITSIEQSNNLPAGGLSAHLQAAGVPIETLVDQLRTQIGWGRVLHAMLGPQITPTDADVAAEKRALRRDVNATRYHVAEIFIPVTSPQAQGDAEHFASTVIDELHKGAPFPIVAAEFSGADSALQGGDRGFVSPDELDAPVAAIITQMPTGAISNPIRVPGGYDIVQLLGKQTPNSATDATLTIRQAFFPFPTPIANAALTPAQQAVVEKAAALSHAAKSCADVAAANAAAGNVHPSDPGPVDLAQVTPPAFQAVLAKLTPGGAASQPLLAPDGVSVVMVCTRQTGVAALPSDDTIRNSIIDHRVSLAAQELLDQLRHQAIITYPAQAASTTAG